MKQLSLFDAAETESDAVVTRKDGKTFTGQVVEHDADGRYKVLTGKRGRPAVITQDEVASISLA